MEGIDIIAIVLLSISSLIASYNTYKQRKKTMKTSDRTKLLID